MHKLSVHSEALKRGLLFMIPDNKVQPPLTYPLPTHMTVTALKLPIQLLVQLSHDKLILVDLC
jgi:hypothetical protein